MGGLPGTYMSANMEDKEEVLVIFRGSLAELMTLTAPKYKGNSPPSKTIDTKSSTSNFKRPFTAY